MTYIITACTIIRHENRPDRRIHTNQQGGQALYNLTYNLTETSTAVSELLELP